MFNEFKELEMKGNLVDMAVGFILGGVDFSNMFINLGSDERTTSLEAAREAGDAAVAYGLFINNIITFLIVAFVMLMIIRAMNSAMNAMEKPEDEAEPEAPTGPSQEDLLTEIRDLLAKQG